MTASIVTRLSRMDRDEFRFRMASALRNASARVRSKVVAPSWRPADLRGILLPAGQSPDWNEARAALATGRTMDAHRALARHFAGRSWPWPIHAMDLPAVAARLRAQSPGAPEQARRQADAILAGRYRLLGYDDVAVPQPVDWHRDHVSGRRAPLEYWSRVRYLDPRYGDHKVTWELNRHQHWLTLGRAFALTGDRRYYRAFVDQLESWLSANPPLMGVNWASMLELAFRTLSWLWALVFFSQAAGDDSRDETRPWTVELLLGLDRQLSHVDANLSRYFSPNTHLTGEALALYVAGQALPHLAASEHRVRLGRAILLGEAGRQVLEDGAHAELSAHYHRYSTDFYLFAASVARCSGDPAAADLEAAARRQAHFLRAICDDQGVRPALGDDDGGQLFPVCGRDPSDCRDTLATAAVILDEPSLAAGPLPEETLWRCGPGAAIRESAPAGRPSAAFESCGYYVIRGSGGDRLILDAGPHGYLNAGHAHADSLAVVLSVGGRPLLIDPGTATYTMDPEVRDRFRSTAMHNTVVVDGRSQSVPHGPFHWQHIANGAASMWRRGAGFDYIEATHDGYLPRRHTRCVIAMRDVGWWIVDHVLGEGTAAVDCFWHVDPSWTLQRADEDGFLMVSNGAGTAIASSHPLSALEPGDPRAVSSPAYGRVVAAPVLRTSTQRALPLTIATFVGCAGTPPVQVSEVPVVRGVAAGWHAAAFAAVSRAWRIQLLVSVERDGVAASESAAPGAPWGTSTLTSDGRAAVLIERAGAPPEVAVANGSIVSAPGSSDPRLARGMADSPHVPGAARSRRTVEPCTVNP